MCASATYVLRISYTFHFGIFSLYISRVHFVDITLRFASVCICNKIHLGNFLSGDGWYIIILYFTESIIQIKWKKVIKIELICIKPFGVRADELCMSKINRNCFVAKWKKTIAEHEQEKKTLQQQLEY